MASRVCNVCLVEKDINTFGTSVGKSGRYYRHTCKECCRERNNEYSRQRNKRDVEKVNARARKWKLENPEQDLARRVRYSRGHKDEMRVLQKKHYEANKDKILAYGKEHVRFRRKTDLKFKLTCILRTRVGHALKGNSKSARTMELLGCSADELKKHLEAKFQTGMTWGNYGRDGWHIDHIIPCASFDLSKSEEQKRCFDFMNLQPLWADENRKKHTKILTAA
jgi:hypothetical protein